MGAGFYKMLGVDEDAASVLLGSNSISVANLITVAGGSSPLPTAITLAANSTSVTPLTFQSGALNSTPVAGGVEYDGTSFYATSVASSRQVIPTEQIQSLTSDYAFGDVNTAQAAFNARLRRQITQIRS